MRFNLISGQILKPASGVGATRGWTRLGGEAGRLAQAERFAGPRPDIGVDLPQLLVGHLCGGESRHPIFHAALPDELAKRLKIERDTGFPKVWSR